MKGVRKNVTRLMSREITLEELQALRPRPSRAHWLTPFLTALKVSGAFYLVRSEWDWRTRGPSQLVQRIGKAANMRFTVSVCSDGTGWVIQRVE